MNPIDFFMGMPFEETSQPKKNEVLFLHHFNQIWSDHVWEANYKPSLSSVEAIEVYSPEALFDRLQSSPRAVSWVILDAVEMDNPALVAQRIRQLSPTTSVLVLSGLEAQENLRSTLETTTGILFQPRGLFILSSFIAKHHSVARGVKCAI